MSWLTSARRVSFCMIDTDVFDSTIAHFRVGLAPGCGQNTARV
jgi:hypothetical protein